MLKIPKAIYDQMLSHAHADYPNECCGLLAGKGSSASGGEVTKLYRMNNTHHSPVSYFMEPREQFRVFKEMRDEGTELLAIYHSHPHTEAYPSRTDVGLAYYPDAVYLIISLERHDHPAVKAYRIVEGQIMPEPLEII